MERKERTWENGTKETKHYKSLSKIEQKITIENEKSTKGNQKSTKGNQERKTMGKAHIIWMQCLEAPFRAILWGLPFLPSYR